ncbi:MAG: aldo/keto reductase family protein [Thermoanaerobaculia bacterium]
MRINVHGHDVPAILYGTAWKKDRTESLVRTALAAGFRGIDTANQRKHYHEAGVGAAIAGTDRDSLFIQTKFTYVEGQDSRLPYDASAGYATQVRESFASSLEHLGIDRIDSYLLHGPRTHRGLSDGDREVWTTMEELQLAGRTRMIGVSNVTAEQLSTLCGIAKAKPAFVQNRCFARMGWDRGVRDVCRSEGVAYQGFSLLTANVNELESAPIVSIARRHGRTLPQIVFRFAWQLGIIALTGTTSAKHMRDDLAIADFELDRSEVEAIERVSG